jgi:hypothetical protein
MYSISLAHTTVVSTHYIYEEEKNTEWKIYVCSLLMHIPKSKTIAKIMMKTIRYL